MTTTDDEPRIRTEGERRAGDHSSGRRFEALLDAADQPVDLDRLATLAVSASAGLGALGAVVMLLDATGDVEVVGTSGVSRSIATSLGPLVLSRRVPLMNAMRTGEPVWLPSPVALRAEYPEFAASPAVGRATASLPLRTGETVIGGLGITFGEAQVFSDTDRALLLAVAAATARGVCAFRSDPAHMETSASLTDSLGDAVIEVDAQGRLVAANTAASGLQGFTGVAVDAAAHAFLHTPDEGGVRRVGLRCLRGVDGGDRFVELHVGARDARGHRRVVGVAIDGDARQPAAAPALFERLTGDDRDRAVQAIFATSMSLAALGRAVPSALRSRVDDLSDRLDRLVADIEAAY